jgi:hypothetical protein
MPVIEPICHSRSGVDDQYCSISKIIMVVANAAFRRQASSRAGLRWKWPSLVYRWTELFADDGITRANQNRPVQGLRLKGLALREFADLLSRKASAERIKERSAAKEKPAGLRRRALVNSLAV